jgi:predicted nucleic acid-binding Zn ribbon protein
VTARSCGRCGTPIPWGVPQCPTCGAWTVWRQRLASFGLLIGAGTVLALLAVLVWIWLHMPAG